MLVVRRLIDSAAKQGWALTHISDGDEEHKVDSTEEALGLIFNLDDAQLSFKRLGKRNLADVIESIYSWCNRLDAGLKGNSAQRDRQVMEILNSLEIK